MQEGLHIGTSGWSYKQDWKGVFYSSPTSLLRQYLTVFDTAEINSSFYALPKPSLIKYLKEHTRPEKFFTAKLPQDLTHINRLHLSGDGAQVLEKFFALMRPIKDRVAALLIQLPPWDMTSMGDLETFLSGLDYSFRYAIEFRHESWLQPTVWSLLERYKIANVIVDEPKLAIDPRITTDFSYVRWHGHGKELWYDYRYNLEELGEWKPVLEGLTDAVPLVLGYFNNHLYGNAPFNALQMLKLMNTITPAQMQKLGKMEVSFGMNQASLDDF
jgi:uncharacterized protein YecE (DUF72 family)